MITQTCDTVSCEKLALNSVNLNNNINNNHNNNNNKASCTANSAHYSNFCGAICLTTPG